MNREFFNLTMGILIIPAGLLVSHIVGGLAGLIWGLNVSTLGIYFLVRLFVDIERIEEVY